MKWAKGLTVFASALVLSGGATSAHSFTDDPSSITPPLQLEANDILEMQEQFGDAAMPLRGVYDQLKLWEAGSTINACFLDGNRQLFDLFASAAAEWTTGTSISIDLTNPNGTYRRCAIPSYDEIRVSFKEKGSYSYVGTDSIRPDVIPLKVSLNIQTDGLPYEKLDPEQLKSTMLHELGHALGLLHEHQSPASRCNDEFDWPKIMDAFTRNGPDGKPIWTEAQVRHNFEALVASPRLKTLPYDTHSIMHYALPAWMFKRGEQSRCFVTEAVDLSDEDRETILQAYPPEANLQGKYLSQSAASMGQVMSSLNLDAEQLAAAGSAIATSLKDYNGSMQLVFPLTENTTVRGIEDEFAFNPCEGETLAMTDAPGVKCGVALDGSALVIATGAK
jgi:hypothetical protein